MAQQAAVHHSTTHTTHSMMDNMMTSNMAVVWLWGQHDGNTGSRTLQHNMQPPDGNTIGSNMAALWQVAVWPQQQWNGDTDCKYITVQYAAASYGTTGGVIATWWTVTQLQCSHNCNMMVTWTAAHHSTTCSHPMVTQTAVHHSTICGMIATQWVVIQLYCNR